MPHEELDLGDPLFQGEIPEADPTVVRRAKDNGAVDRASEAEFYQRGSDGRFLKSIQIFVLMRHHRKSVAELGKKTGEVARPGFGGR